MKVKLLSGVCIGAGIDAFHGSIHDIDDPLALEFINQNRAVHVVEEELEVAPEPINPDVIENRDPLPRKRR